LKKAEILEVEWANVPKIIKHWLPEPIIKNLIKSHVERNFERLEKDDYADRFFDYHYVDGSEPGDYQHQVIELSKGNKLMTGIRFFNLEKNKAYIEIEHTNFKQWNIELFNEAALAIKERYKIFKPFAFRILSSVDYAKQFPILNIEKDLSFYVGLKGNILSIEKPVKYDEVTLVRPENLDFYSLYQGAVEFYIDENPGSEQYVFALSRKEIERLHKNRTLFCPYIDEQWAGVIAVDRSSEKYLEGYLIVEEVIIKKFRGRNFAAAIQHKLIEMIPGDDFTLIYGEIHENNIPSRKTAARNGRIRSGTYYFINI